MNLDVIREVKNRKSLHSHLAMITCIILGNTCRQAVKELSDYSPSYVDSGSVLWSNCAGCIMMGLIQAFNTEAGWFIKYPVLFTALSTGLCGSFSSLSTMMIEVFEHSTSLTPANIKNHTKLPNRAYGIMEFISVVITQLAVSVIGLIFGRFLGAEIVIKYASIENLDFDKGDKTIKRTPHPLVKKIMKILFYTVTISAIPLLILFIVLTSYYDNSSRGNWTLPPLFGLFGAYGRIYLSKWLNPKSKKFYFGTFTANVFATLLAAVFTLVLRGKKNYNDPTPIIHKANICYIVTALLDGVCGSLSTMSTFANEVCLLPLGHTLIYISATIGLSYCFLVIILGSYAWTRGLTAAYC